MLLLQWGMQAGTLVAVQPGVTLADPVVAISLGILLFGEAIRGGLWLVPEIIAAAVITWATFALSRSEAVLEKMENPLDDSPHVSAPAIGPLVRSAAERFPPPNGSTRAGLPPRSADAAGSHP